MRIRRPGPSISDWLLPVLSTLSAGVALHLALARGERAGFAIAAFFGAGVVFGGWMLIVKLETAAHAGAAVEVAGMVPLRARRTQLFTMAAGMLLTSGAGVIFGTELGGLFVGVSGLIAVVGVVVLALFGARALPMPFLQFEPDGLRIGVRRATFLLAWDNVATVAPGSVAGHDLVLLAAQDIERLIGTATMANRTREQAGAWLRRHVRSNRSWYGADLVIMPTQFGTDAALLVRALARYVGDPASRQSLSDRAQLA